MAEARVLPISRDQPGRCRAITVRGQPCRNRSVQGGLFCARHQPAPEAAKERPAQRADLQQLLDVLARRLRGDYETDVFGFDRELTELLLPALRPLVRNYWRVDVVGAERIPGEGAALLAANHAGTLPLDGVVLRSVVWDGEPHRHLRILVADLGFAFPFLSAFFRKTGNTLARPEDARRLLEQGELIAAFPEGYKGLGKSFRDRYRLQRFGRGGFVEVAIQTKAPIVPVAIVGSEEIYPMVADVRPLARLLGLPYFPVTPFFPALGALGLVPLPSKWIIEFCDPIPTDHLPADAHNDPMTVFEFTDHVRQSISRTLVKNLRRRRSAFW